MKTLPRTSARQYFNYSVIESSGLKETQFQYLSDNNSATFIQFAQKPKSLTLKFDEQLNAGNFGFSIDADLFDLGEIEVSPDGRDFTPILISDIESFSFRFVRLSFVDNLRNSKTTLFAPTKIRDILFYKNEPVTYLTKSLSSEPIAIYTQPGCENKEMNQALS